MAKKAEKEAINWKAAALRGIYGERVELKSLPGFWVQARKLSKAGEAEVTAVLARQQMKKSSVRRAILAEARKTEAEKSELASMAGDVSPDVQDQILDAVTDSMTAGELSGLDTAIVEIAYGIHAHNFNGEPEGATLEWARELVEFRDVFDEVLAAVLEMNPPLGRRMPS